MLGAPAQYVAPSSPGRRRGWSAGQALAGLGALLATLSVNGCASLGERPAGARLSRIERSPQWKDGAFQNPEPLESDLWGALTTFGKSSPHRIPDGPIPVETPDPTSLRTPPASGLRVTWLGHSTFLLDLDGLRILTDPVWSDRPSPLGWLGPRRFFAPPIALADLPPIDAVAISHDHYDHLDHPTIQAMRAWPTRFVVPLGVGAHLARWGIPEERIVELDWWESTRVGDVEIHATPARHASGRSTGPRSNRTLWAGFAFVGPAHRAWYSGDTGLFPGMRAIGERLGPFDVTLVEAGAYSRWWPDWHLGPEQAVAAHRLVRGRVLIPAHWGTFNLAFHAWTEPAERLLAAAEREGEAALVPRPGQPVEPGVPLAVERWWPAVPTRTAAQDPIVSSRLDGLGTL